MHPGVSHLRLPRRQLLLRRLHQALRDGWRVHRKRVAAVRAALVAGAGRRRQTAWASLAPGGAAVELLCGLRLRRLRRGHRHPNLLLLLLLHPRRHLLDHQHASWLRPLPLLLLLVGLLAVLDLHRLRLLRRQRPALRHVLPQGLPAPVACRI